MDCFVHALMTVGARFSATPPSPPTACWHFLAAFLCLPFHLLLSLLWRKAEWGEEPFLSQEEISGNEKMGRKGNSTPWQQPHYCKPATFQAWKGLPQPFLPICFACTFQKTVQKLCLLLLAPAPELWRRHWGPGSACFLHWKKRAC